MDDRLAEFASVQVEAIDEVLEMVDRDRRRVEALLCEAESPSLRQYLQEWMDATPPSRPNGNVQHHSVQQQWNAATRRGEVLASDINNNSSSCWSDPSKSFWEIMPSQSYRKLTHDHNSKAAMQQHHLARSRLAYGVSYDWLMRPTLGFVHGDDLRVTTTYWEWEDMDHFFKGRDCKILNENVNNVQHLFAEQQSASEFELFRKVLVPYIEWPSPSEGSSGGNSLLMTRFFGGSDNPLGCCDDFLPSANQVLKAGGSLTYDIIYYAASIGTKNVPMLYHHRTAKGTMILNVSTQKANSDEEDESEGGSARRHVLEGSVELDPSMQCVDAVPYGGNFSWKETNRLERVISERNPGSDWNYSSTTVMLVNVTSVPSASPNTSTIDRKAIGEVRVVRQRTAAMINHASEGDKFDYAIPSDVAAHNQTASERMDAYNNKRCLWMHRHTTLPKDVIERVGDFVCPPPAFYFEEGDLVIDIDWSDIVRPLPDRADGLESLMSSNSSIVARPRT